MDPFTVKIDGEEHEVSRITIGDTRVLAREYGITGELRPGDPNGLAAMVFLALRQRHRDLPAFEVVKMVDDIDIEAIVDPASEEPDEDVGDPDPTTADRARSENVNGGSKAKRAKSGASTRKTSGARS